MSEGENAEAWKVFSEHYEPKTATRYVGMLRQILLYDFGELTQLIVVTNDVRQTVFPAGIKDAAIGDHLALHAGRLNSFDKMAAEVSTVAKTHNENVVPLDVSVIKGKGGKGKDGKGKQGKEGNGKTQAKEDKDKLDSKSNPNKFKKCFYCGKDGHVRADCRKKKRDDEERRNMSPQNSLNASSAAPSPSPGLTNATSTSGANSSSLKNFTVRCGSLSSDATQTFIESWLILVHPTVLVRQINSPQLENHGEKLVPYMAQDSGMVLILSHRG